MKLVTKTHILYDPIGIWKCYHPDSRQCSHRKIVVCLGMRKERIEKVAVNRMEFLSAVVKDILQRSESGESCIISPCCVLCQSLSQVQLSGGPMDAFAQYLGFSRQGY